MLKCIKTLGAVTYGVTCFQAVSHCMLSAGEGEYVAFANECSCDGPVESWLQNVVDAMRAALSHEFKVAIPAYDEKPRIKWIFDYSVQNTIMVSRTFFTQDVNEAFEELEEGNEDALKARSHALTCCHNTFLGNGSIPLCIAHNTCPSIY